jgi:hypothetical protein
MLRLLCIFSAAMIAVASIGSVSSAAPPFVVTIEVSISGAARPIVIGTTNLPDGTLLWIAVNKPWLPDGRQRLASGLAACGDDCAPLTTAKGMADKVVVKNGRFTDGPFTDKGGALSPGVYILDIYGEASSLDQSAEVLAVIGEHGENLSGPLVATCCIGAHHGMPEKIINDQLEQERRSRAAAIARGDLSTSILYRKYIVVGEPASPVASSPVDPLAVQPPNPDIARGKEKLSNALNDEAAKKRSNWESIPVPPSLDGTSYAFDKSTIADRGGWGAEVVVKVIGGDISIRGKSLLFGFDCDGTGRYRINHSRRAT